MKKSGRYKTSHWEEDQYEPGSRRSVLKNLVGVKNKTDMDRLENEALRAAEAYFFKYFDKDHCFTANDICLMHRVWLGKIYPWAGKYRQVNLTKGDFPFAAARQIQNQMQQLEAGALRQHTPCHFDSKDRVVKALAEVHAEIVLIHPFREGNGRVARLLAVLMSLQANLPPLDFSKIKGKRKETYFSAVRAAAGRNYEPMEKIFKEVLATTLPPR